MELQQDDLSIVSVTLRYADKLWHPQFFGAITFVSQRLTIVFQFVEHEFMTLVGAQVPALDSKLDYGLVKEVAICSRCNRAGFRTDMSTAPDSS